MAVKLMRMRRDGMFGKVMPAVPKFMRASHRITPVFPKVMSDVPKVMRAAQYTDPDALKHVEVPVPAPAKDEVLLKVEAASLNPLDWKMQTRIWRPYFPPKFPHIPGTDVAGEVVEVGARVKEFKAGDKVVSLLSHVWGGGLAEYAVAKEELTVLRPPQVSAAEGAGLPIAGLTALQALKKKVDIKLDGSGKQKSILIRGASGGVGHYAVQLAKLGKTHVTANCGTQNIEFVRRLGADDVLSYTAQTLRSLSGCKYDAVLHCATDIPQSTVNLSTNREVIYLTPDVSAKWTLEAFPSFKKKQLVPEFVSLKKKNLECLVGLVKEGKLKTVIDSRHPLSNAEAAWTKRIYEDGDVTGKIIVEPYT